MIFWDEGIAEENKWDAIKDWCIRNERGIDLNNVIDFTPTVEQLAWMERFSSIVSRIQSIPNWSTWNETEANNWGQTNIGAPLSDARINLNALQTLSLTTFKAATGMILDILDNMWTMQQAFGRMLIALRDKNWPDLSE